MKEGEFVIVNSNEVHSIFAPDLNLTLVIQIPLVVFEEYYIEKNFITFSHDSNYCDKDMMGIMKEMYRAYVAKKCGYEFLTQTKFYHLLYLMVTVYRITDVSDERVKEVCKEVGLDHFIRTLPKGYDSYLSENDSVSAGQRQLLTIARGMIQDSPFLILDEATSNVDTRTEELVQVAMDKLTEGRTSFIIAHRLSTIKNADLILVMKDGNIVEQGNHEQLMAKNGAYAELYNSQFEL